MANDYIGAYSGAKIDELLGKADTQVYTKAEVNSALAQKVDAVAGMGLSEESYTASEKQKLAGLSNYDDTDIAGGVAAALASGARNHLKNTASDHTNSGVTFTVGTDGTITANGTASSNATMVWDTSVPAGSYIFTCGEAPNRSLTYDAMILDLDNSSAVIARDNPNDTPGNTFTLSRTTNVRIHIRITEGYSCNSLVFRPMLRSVYDKDPSYSPYAPGNRELYEMLLALNK